MAWKTPRLRVAQARSYGSTALIYTCRYIERKEKGESVSVRYHPETSGCPDACGRSHQAGAAADVLGGVRARPHAANSDVPGSWRPGTPYACRTSPVTYPHSRRGSKAAACGWPP